MSRACCRQCSGLPSPVALSVVASATPCAAASTSRCHSCLSPYRSSMVRASSRAHRAKPYRGGKPSPKQQRDATKAAFKQRPTASRPLNQPATASRRTDQRTVGATEERQRRRPKSKAERVAWQETHPRQHSRSSDTQQAQRGQRGEKRKAAADAETQRDAEGDDRAEAEEDDEEERPAKRLKARLVSDNSTALSLLDGIVESTERREQSKLSAEDAREQAAQRLRQAVERRKERKRQQQQAVMDQARRLLSDKRKAAKAVSGHSGDRTSSKGKKRAPTTARPRG